MKNILNNIATGIKNWALDTPSRAKVGASFAWTDTKAAVAEPVRSAKRAAKHGAAVFVGREVFNAETNTFEGDKSMVGRGVRALKCVGNLVSIPFDIINAPIQICTAWLRAGLHTITGFNHDVCDGLAHAATGIASFIAVPHAVAAVGARAAAFAAGTRFVKAAQWKTVAAAVATGGAKFYGFFVRLTHFFSALGGIIEAGVISVAMFVDHYFGHVTNETVEDFAAKMADFAAAQDAEFSAQPSV